MTGWTPERRKLATDHYLAGRSVEWIAQEMGAPSPDAVKMALSRWGVRRGVSNWTQRPPRKPRAQDIATRLAILLGEAPRPPEPRRSIHDEMLLRFAGRATEDTEAEALFDRIQPFIARPPVCAEDEAIEALRRLAGFDAYARDLLAVEPQDHQLAAAFCLLAGKSFAWVKGRQLGADWLAGLFIGWECIVSPARTLVISQAQRQSDMLAETTARFLARSPEASDTVGQSNRERMAFLSGSEAWFLPSEGAIRGLSDVSRIIVNEAAFVDEAAFESVQPMLAKRNGSLCLMSSPMGRLGRFYEYAMNDAFSLIQLPSKTNRYLSPDYLEAEKLRMSADAWDREYGGNWSDVQGAFFSAESIERARRDYSMSEAPEEGKAYSIGYDPARVRDSSVITVLSRDADGHLRVENIRAFNNTPFPDQLAYLRWLLETFKPAVVMVEYSGLGIGPCEQLEQGGFPVQRFVPTVASKLEAFGDLKARLERNELTIPASETKLAVELRMFQFKVTTSGNVTLHHISGQGDDYADSLCFASWGLRGSIGQISDETLKWLSEEWG